MKDLIIFLSENWKVLSWGATCLAVVITVIFNLVDRYRKIPAMCSKITELEEKQGEVCPQHDTCFKDLQDDIQKLDEKICKEVGKVNTTLREMELSREQAKDKLSDHLLKIHETLGLIQGELKHVSN